MEREFNGHFYHDPCPMLNRWNFVIFRLGGGGYGFYVGGAWRQIWIINLMYICHLKKNTHQFHAHFYYKQKGRKKKKSASRTDAWNRTGSHYGLSHSLWRKITGLKKDGCRKIKVFFFLHLMWAEHGSNVCWISAIKKGVSGAVAQRCKGKNNIDMDMHPSIFSTWIRAREAAAVFS